jgi:hypothetical protein
MLEILPPNGKRWGFGEKRSINVFRVNGTPSRLDLASNLVFWGVSFHALFSVVQFKPVREFEKPER